MATKTSQLIRGLIASNQRPVLATKSQAIASLKHKLTAQGVGRIKGGEHGPRPMSWVAGFKALHDKPFVSGALRKLDRIRRKQVGRLSRANIQYGTGRTGTGKRLRDPGGLRLQLSCSIQQHGRTLS